MSVFTAIRDRRRTPEPIVTGTGEYRLHDNSVPVRHEQRFETLAAAMTAAGTTDPDDWHNQTGFDRIYSKTHAIDKTGWIQKVIEAPGLDTEFLTLQTRKRAEREQARAASRQRELDETARREEERKANWARWDARVAAEKAKKAAEDAAKPKLVISYLTRAGGSLGDADLRVEVVTRPGWRDCTDHTETAATCKACGESETVQWDGTGWGPWGRSDNWFDNGGAYATPRAQEWAQKHAEACRAMPAKS